MIRHWFHARQKGWGYPPKKTACQSGLRFQRYKPLKSVTTAGGPAGRRAGRPLILRFLVYISRNSLRASRSLVTRPYQTSFGHLQNISLDPILSYLGQLGIELSSFLLQEWPSPCGLHPYWKHLKCYAKCDHVIWPLTLLPLADRDRILGTVPVIWETPLACYAVPRS